jgi:putative addiction module component (TIGR02574 family)
VCRELGIEPTRSNRLLGDDARATLIPVTKEAARLLEEALKLDSAGRAQLASQLIASLDSEVDKDAEEAWAAEIEERAARARSGVDPGEPWQAVRDRLKQDLLKG